MRGVFGDSTSLDLTSCFLGVCSICFAARVSTSPLPRTCVISFSVHSDPELLRALEAAVVSDRSSDGDSSISSDSSGESGGDEGSTHQTACDGESSFLSALGGSSDGHSNDCAGDKTTNLLSNLSSRNSDGGKDAGGVSKVDEDVSKVHVGDQARRGGSTVDEVAKAMGVSRGGILRQRGGTSPFLLGVGAAVVFLFMAAKGWSQCLFTAGAGG